MPPDRITDNTLFYGDNLTILREHIPDESIDLIYLDPPFNSKRTYNVLFKEESGLESEAQITAFEDTWHWDEAAQETYRNIISNSQTNVATMIGALFEFIGTNQMMAYLVMMTARLQELHRVLKSTGSIYLHCDPTASHYLKIVMDAIFGAKNFMNEIVWKRTSAHSDPLKFGANIDIILFYSKSSEYTWNQLHKLHEQTYLSRFRFKDPDGRFWTDGDLTAKGLSGGGYEYEYKGVKSLWRFPLEKMKQLDVEGRLHFTQKGGIRLKRYLENTKGVVLQALWDDIPPINSQSKERLGYPTQKPLALLERIINASSNKEDWVLDPFCGCGTAIAAAQKLNRHWIGIDITHLAIALQKYRLKDMFNLAVRSDYKVIGEPEDIAAAYQLAHENRYQFQWWALSLIKAKPFGGEAGSKKGKKGKDKGIDGIINFIDDSSDKVKRVLVQVKSGKVKSGDIRDLKGTIERENASIGIFITLESPTKDMKTEAITSGYYRCEAWEKDYPKIQILTIEQLLKGEQVQMPSIRPTFKQARREIIKKEQPGLW